MNKSSACGGERTPRKREDHVPKASALSENIRRGPAKFQEAGGGHVLGGEVRLMMSARIRLPRKARLCLIGHDELQVALKQGTVLCCVQQSLRKPGLAKPQPKRLMRRPNTAAPKNTLYLVTLPSQASICGLPVLAFCLKKETLLRKRPITPAPWRQLYLSLLLPSTHL